MKRPWRRWLADRRWRADREAELTWFRLRYRDPAALRHCLALLSRQKAAGRVLLCFRPEQPVSRLYAGLPTSHTVMLQQMAVDFGFLLQPVESDEILPAPQPLVPTADFPWDHAFVAHIVDGQSLVSGLAGRMARSRTVTPATNNGQQGPSWHLPQNPPPGLSLQPVWDNRSPPESLQANLPDPHCWPLGMALDGTPLHSSKPLNIYGRPVAVADWLKSLALQSLTMTPAGLMLIDGAGQLGPALKRQQAVTQKLGRQVLYVDLDNPALNGGYNPLAPAPGEQENDTLSRWQRWFGATGVHREGLALLARAQQEGVADIPALQRWLQRPQQHQNRAAAGLRVVLQRLLAEPGLGDWLTWPTNCYDALAESTLIFTCSSQSWAHRQLLLSALLVAVGNHSLRIVAHGIPWKEFPLVDFNGRMVTSSNGPPTAGGIIIMVTGAGRLASRFFPLDAQLQENLHLLGQGEAVIVVEGNAVYASWQKVTSRDPSAGKAEGKRDNTTIA